MNSLQMIPKMQPLLVLTFAIVACGSSGDASGDTDANVARDASSSNADGSVSDGSASDGSVLLSDGSVVVSDGQVIVPGTIPLGEPCPVGGSATCEEAGYCRRAELSCGGVCVRRATAGEPCGPYGAASYAECGTELRCVFGMCSTLGAAGSACQSIEDCQAGLLCRGRLCYQPRTEGEPCGNAYPCDDMSFCNRDKVCEKKRPPGSSCSPGGQCAEDGICTGTPFACKATIGGSCQKDDDCYRSHCIEGRCGRVETLGAACLCPTCCAEGMWCIDSTCQERNPGSKGAGESCQFMDDCEGGLICSCQSNPPNTELSPTALCDEAGTCVAFAPDGGDCGTHNMCRSGLCGADGKCASRATLGDPCFADGDCGPYQACVESSCQYYRAFPVIANCEDSRTTRLFNGHCVPSIQDGKGCSKDDDCESGACNRGICSDPADAKDGCDTNADCRGDLICEGQPGLCAQSFGLGENCGASSSPSPCTGDLVCNPYSDTCTAACE